MSKAGEIRREGVEQERCKECGTLWTVSALRARDIRGYLCPLCRLKISRRKK